jgi:hypothetical protein
VLRRCLGPQYCDRSFGRHIAWKVASGGTCDCLEGSSGPGERWIYLASRRLQLREVLAGMVRRAGQRARRHHQEALGVGDLLVACELVRGHLAHHGVMLAGRLQILPDGQKVDVGRAQIVHHLQHLVALFAQAHHDAGLGEDRRIDLLDPLQQLIEGFSHFVTSMTATIASGWSGCRVGLVPTGKRRLRTAHTQAGRRDTSETCQRAAFASRANQHPIFDHLVAADFIILVQGSDARHRELSAAD